MRILKEKIQNCYYKTPTDFMFVLHCETYWKRLWVFKDFSIIPGYSSKINPPELNNKIYFNLVHYNRINSRDVPVTLLINQALKIPMRN